jgi:alkanesulfonate monooxygenase SsuD/methylene tetrahydromethanopterin reductase-like flavin-dependent oxidoreductase (luciferase family)
VNEHAAYGIDLGATSERLDRFEEACEVISSLLRHRRTTHAGRYFRLRDAPNQPAPVHGRLPLLIGGGGERRTLRIAARYADEWNYWSTPTLLAQKLVVLRDHCEALERDPASLRVSTQALLLMSSDAEQVARHRERAFRFSIVGTPAEVADIVSSYQAGRRG